MQGAGSEKQKEIKLEIEGGEAPEPFVCTGCKRTKEVGSEYLEIHVLDGLFGPLCVDCWPKVPPFLEQATSHPGISADVTKVSKEVMARYQAAKGRFN